MECTDPRLTGRRTIFTDGYLQADGSMACYGAAYNEVGSWEGTNFTSTGGLWEVNWNGVMQPNYSMQASQTAYGSGGALEGWRIEEAITRGPGTNAYDPTVPILYTGTIRPPPVSTNLVSEGFASGLPGWTFWGDPTGITYYATNQQLFTRADWRGVLPQPLPSMFLLRAPQRSWSLADGQTLEAAVDVVRISEDSTNSARLYVGSDGASYEFGLGNNGVYLMRWNGLSVVFTMLWSDETVRLRRTNVTLYMTLTRDKQNAIITTRVVDGANPSTVLYEHNFVHSPGATTPIFSGTGGGLGIFQWQFSDSTQPPVEAIWDNFSLRLHDVPPLSIARAVQVSWPAPSGVNFTVQSGPTVQGPWSPVQELDMPGIQKQSVPAGSPSQFFRLVQAP